RRTCARGSAREEAGTAYVPPSAPGASPRRSQEDRLQLSVDPLRREALDRGGRGGGEPLATDKGDTDRGGQALRVSGRHEQAVLPVLDDLRHAADRCCDHGRPDREGLDDRV